MDFDGPLYVTMSPLWRRFLHGRETIVFQAAQKRENGINEEIRSTASDVAIQGNACRADRINRAFSSSRIWQPPPF